MSYEDTKLAAYRAEMEKASYSLGAAALAGAGVGGVANVLYQLGAQTLNPVRIAGHGDILFKDRKKIDWKNVMQSAVVGAGMGGVGGHFYRPYYRKAMKMQKELHGLHRNMNTMSRDISRMTRKIEKNTGTMNREMKRVGDAAERMGEASEQVGRVAEKARTNRFWGMFSKHAKLLGIKQGPTAIKYKPPISPKSGPVVSKGTVKVTGVKLAYDEVMYAAYVDEMLKISQSPDTTRLGHPGYPADTPLPTSALPAWLGGTPAAVSKGNPGASRQARMSFRKDPTTPPQPSPGIALGRPLAEAFPKKPPPESPIRNMASNLQAGVTRSAGGNVTSNQRLADQIARTGRVSRTGGGV